MFIDPLEDEFFMLDKIGSPMSIVDRLPFRPRILKEKVCLLIEPYY